MKKGLWRRLGAFLALLALLATCLTGGTLAQPAEVPDAGAGNAESGQPFTGAGTVAENEALRLYLDADTHLFYVENKATGYRWSNYPTDMAEMGIEDDYVQSLMKSMLNVVYYNHELEADDDTSSYLDAVQSGSVTYETVQNGFRATFTFGKAALTVPLEVTLQADSFRAAVDTTKMVYDEKALSVLELHLLPYMGAMAHTKTDAYAMIPDGSGALVYAGGSKPNAPSYQKPVFGKDITIDIDDQQGITLPCFGVADGKNVLLGVIDEDEADAYINCETYGQMTNKHTHPWASFKTTVDFEYALVSDYYSTRVFEEGPIAAEKLAVSYYPLSGDAAGYVQMAEKYRELLFSAEQLAAAKTEAALYLDLYASVTKVRSILGFKSNYDDVLTSTEDVSRIVNKLKELGVDSTVVRYNAWNKQENAGKTPTKVSWKGSVGDIDALIAEMAALNCKVFPAVSRVLTYDKSSNPLHTMSGVTRDPASRLIMDGERYLTTSRTGESYLLNYAAMDKNLSALLTDAAEKGVDLALSDVAHMLYSDYSEGAYKRPAFVEMISDKLAAYAATNDLLVEAPNAYAAPYADEIIHLPTASSGNVLLDEDIPFLQLVYSGVVRYSAETLNLQGSPRAAFLKALEYGAMPCYAWVGDGGSAMINTELDYLFSADSNYWMATAVAQYKAVNDLLTKAGGTVMTAHTQVAEGVYKTTYGNGTFVLVNYNAAAYEADGISVPAMGYVIGG